MFFFKGNFKVDTTKTVKKRSELRIFVYGRHCGPECESVGRRGMSNSLKKLDYNSQKKFLLFRKFL